MNKAQLYKMLAPYPWSVFFLHLYIKFSYFSTFNFTLNLNLGRWCFIFYFYNLFTPFLVFFLFYLCFYSLLHLNNPYFWLVFCRFLYFYIFSNNAKCIRANLTTYSHAKITSRAKVTSYTFEPSLISYNSIKKVRRS